MTDTRDPLIVFSPSGKRGRFPAGTTVLQAARKLGVDLDSVCGGRAICGRCQVSVTEGELPKHGMRSSAANLSARGEAEEKYATRRKLAAGRRLSCQATLCGDIAIDVPATSQVHRQLVRKPYEAHDIEVDPVTHPYYVEVAQPDMHDPSGDLERLRDALARDWQLTGLAIAHPALQSLQTALRAGRWTATVAVREQREIVAVWPGFRGKLFGIAIDIGSTTIAAHLCDLASGEVMTSAGRMNPQIRFGEDLMSRVSYVMMNPGGETELTAVVREAINELVAEVADNSGIEPEDIVELTLVGNPIMMHLVQGLNPVELGVAPFALATDSSVTIPARELGLRINPGGYVYALPCIAGHVGADTAGVLLAEAPYDRDEISLIVDVGTNAEILLGNRERLLAASSPTGPAFEGAQISAGQRAAPGAIERVRIDPQTLEPRFKVIGCERWSDEAEFVDELPGSGVTGICGSGIIEAIAELYLAGVIAADGTISGSNAARSPRVVPDGRTFSYTLLDGEPGVRIQQGDVRAIQLAKAALYAGARLLMEKLGVESVDRIRLAGAFGAHIDVKYAMVLGMIPDCRLDQVSPAGNAAGTGARICLLDRGMRPFVEARTRGVEKIETAVEPRFQHHFVEAMAIPHGSDPFAELQKVVTLPKRVEPSEKPVRGRNRRRR
ncbi:MAG: ASKHA domain-containing protein [Gammaproteobacteria bacterium]|nr:ASKHA domain-containing protein [Gammaproteobacteria bacterium]MDH4254963.1 ASKHA domain-containing protein [Gammaproteobacteria bacterium]MDH5310222.1 ASKHA domain-containing protein [Gammaproteobacteria bacterium]